MRMKAVALSTPVDVVIDDALPNIQRALKNHGLEPRQDIVTDSGLECPMTLKKTKK